MSQRGKTASKRRFSYSVTATSLSPEWTGRKQSQNFRDGPAEWTAFRCSGCQLVASSMRQSSKVNSDCLRIVHPEVEFFANNPSKCIVGQGDIGPKRRSGKCGPTLDERSAIRKQFDLKLALMGRGDRPWRRASIFKTHRAIRQSGRVRFGFGRLLKA